MNAQELIDTANALVADEKGLLAMDESNPTCNKRFARLGIWSGNDANVEAAQTALAHRAHCNHAARRGEYSADLESTEVASVGDQR